MVDIVKARFKSTWGDFEAEGLDKLGKYYRDKAEIVFASSMSRKGWFGQLIVTQIKKEQKETREPTAEVKRSIFGRGKRQEAQLE